MYPFFCTLLVVIIPVVLSSQIVERSINSEYPNVLQLFTYYIPKKEPFVARQVLLNDTHYDLWKTDERLLNEVDGLTKINVHGESLKEQKRTAMKFGEFMERYQTEQLFFENNVPEILRQYLVVPQPLQCQAILPTLQPPILMINGIQTSSLLYRDDFDTLVCLLRGRKQLILIDTNEHSDLSEIDTPGSPLNPDRVDFTAGIDINHHLIEFTAGDCLFLPIEWVFQERSLESTISVIYHLDHKQAINIDANEVETCVKEIPFDSSFTLEQLDWTSMEDEPQNLRDMVLKLIGSKSNTFDHWQKEFSKHLSFDLSTDPEVSAMFDEFYGIIDLDGNGEVTMDEIERIDGAHGHHINDIIYELVNLVNQKQEKHSSKDFDEYSKTDL